MVPARVRARLLASLVPSPKGCMVTTYSTGSHGYGQIGWHDRERGRSVMVLAHRVAWEALRGPIPDDLTIDHICRNPRCCNVDHLRLLTNVENARDNRQAQRGPGRRSYKEVA